MERTDPLVFSSTCNFMTHEFSLTCYFKNNNVIDFNLFRLSLWLTIGAIKLKFWKENNNFHLFLHLKLFFQKFWGFLVT